MLSRVQMTITNEEYNHMLYNLEIHFFTNDILLHEAPVLIMFADIVVDIM